MKVLIDTNVALDILLNRIEFYSNSVGVFVMAEKKLVTGYISASSITDIFYIAQRKLGKKAVKEAVKTMLQVFSPATVTDNNIYQALDLDWDDFEDSVQYIVGEGLSVDYIVTRNTQDFACGSIPAVTPEQFIKIITCGSVKGYYIIIIFDIIIIRHTINCIAIAVRGRGFPTSIYL